MLQSETSFWFLVLQVTSATTHTHCILHFEYSVNRLSNRSLSKRVLFIKPLSWTSGMSVPVLQNAQPHICFSNIVEGNAKFHNVKLAGSNHTQLDNKAKMKQISLKLYLFCSPFCHCLSSVLNELTQKKLFTDTKLSIWLKKPQLKYRLDIYKQNNAQAFFSLFFYVTSSQNFIYNNERDHVFSVCYICSYLLPLK